MRQLAVFDVHPRAVALGEALFGSGIDCTIQPGRDGTMGVWIHDERRMDDARGLLARFMENPDSEEIAALQKGGRDRRSEKGAEERQSRHRTIRAAEALQQRERGSPVILTFGLMGLCVLVFFLTGGGFDQTTSPAAEQRAVLLWIVDRRLGASGWPGLLHTLRSEPWRFVSPGFLHGGPLHLFFNLWWLKDLGGLIERHFSGWYLLALFLLIAVPSNVGQYLWSGPAFGGMSGVVFGLFGFVWIRGRLDVTVPFMLHRQTVVLMLVWLVFCYALDRIANVVHTVGLLVGAFAGLVTARRPWRR